MRSVAIMLLAVAACFSKPPRPGDGSEPDGPQVPDGAEGWLDGFAFRKHVTVSAGAQQTLVNFPVGVVIEDSDLDTNARSDGRDIVATALDGTTPIASELVSYKQGALELWVQLAELGETGAFYLYYGGDQQPGSTAVWNELAGVWHLSETGEARDSTANANHMTGTGSETPEPFSPGIFGGARVLDGNDKITAGDPANSSLDFGMESFSYSVWVHQTATGLGGFDTPFMKGGLSNSEAGYCLLLGNANWTAKLSDGAAHIADPEFGSSLQFLNRWVLVTTVVDRTAGTMTAYLDGNAKDSKPLAAVGSISTAAPIQIGRGTEQPFTGRLDELRIYKTALTPAWIATEFRNGTEPGFITLGPQEAK